MNELFKEKLSSLQIRLFHACLADDLDRQMEEVLEVIKDTSGCMISSIWSLNTKLGGSSTSLLKRSVPEEYASLFTSHSDYVHEFSNSFIEDVISFTISDRRWYYCCDSSQCRKHRSLKQLEAIGLRFFVGIPIHSKIDDSILGIVCLYYEAPYFREFLADFSRIINQEVSAIWERSLIIKKQMLSERMFQIKKDLDQNDSMELFFAIVLKELLWIQCEYEGASVFIWDACDNHFKLAASTGLENYGKETVYYYGGEGLTGRVAITKRIAVYNSLTNEKGNGDHLEKWKEKTHHEGKTLMVIPILRVSNSNDVIGIIRIVNKLNKENHKTLDFFNALDVDVIGFLSNQLSLILESYLSDGMKSDFLRQLSHEMLTPAQSISKSAISLIHYYDEGEEEFLQQNLRKYLDDILYYSEFQKWQVKTNLCLSKGNSKTPLCKQYEVQGVKLYDLLKKSKSLINPIARINRVQIDNIVISSLIPNITLYLDINAFVTIFYNLLTNAIKYRDPQQRFFIRLSSFELPEGIVVDVEDYGLGIEPNEQDKIFQLGYRSDNVCRENMSGFGVGLAVVRKLLTDFDSSIKVTNFRNPTQFRIVLSNMLRNNNYISSEPWTK